MLFGGLPVLGLLAELKLGALSFELPLFPTGWHALAVAIAVVANLLLHLGMFRGRSNLGLRAVLIGFVAGMALLYGLAEAPALLFMLILAIFGLGVLAAAPYFALLGMTALIPELLRDWRDSGRPRAQLFTILIALMVLPFGASAALAWKDSDCVTKMGLLADALGDRQLPNDQPPNKQDAVEIARLAAELRKLDIATQRAVCVAGSEPADRRWLAGNSYGQYAHIGDGRPFWFLASLEPKPVSAEAARRVFHCVHGEAWDDGVLPASVQPWVEGHKIEWRSSKLEVQVEPAAALANVAWHLEVGSSSPRLEQARFDLRLPVGAVASSLSLVIDGAPRPAAFAAASQVEKAFDSVVAKMRDPALLQEIGPGLLRLRLFPVSNRSPQMQVTIGFTMPLGLLGTDALLCLPQVISHNCGMGRLGAHTIRIHGDGDLREQQLDDEQLKHAIRLPRGDANTCSLDADGFVVQELVPRQPATTHERPCIVVLEASASVSKRKGDLAAILNGLAVESQPGRKCVLFLVAGSQVHRQELALASPELRRVLAEQAFVGGADARNGLCQALLEAAAVGQQRIYWLHGAMADWQNGAWPILNEQYDLATLALHDGRNVLRDAPQLDRHAVTVPRIGNSAEQLRQALQSFERWHSRGANDTLGDTERRWTRVSQPPEGVVRVSDQVSRLWAAHTARELVVAGNPVAAAQLAARYRLATAGAGAVVLESKTQYQQHGLEPGAAIGREPDEAIGSLPVAEPSTLVLFGSGLVLLLWWRRRCAK